MTQKSIKYEQKSLKEQLTARGLVIGVVGSVIISCSSMFVALKISSLPWPIMFVALFSMFALKALGNTNIHEINVTHTAMSAGAMVAGGLAFTIPGIWMLNPDAEVRFLPVMVLTLGGVVLGLIFTSLLRKHFIETAELPYAMGQAAAQTLVVGDEGGKKAGLLFGAIGFSGLFAVLRDWFHKIPAVVFSPKMLAYGSYGGFYLSPMLVSIGYIIGPVVIGVWFLGALIGDVGILIGGQTILGWEASFATAIKQSLGLGMMVGTGLAIVIKELLPRFKTIFGSMFSKDSIGDSIVPLRWAPIAMAIIAFLLTFACDIPILASIITILGAWLATAMSAQCVGQSGINPMEIFGIFILLIARAVAPMSGVSAFFVAAVVAVACGVCGDVFNDFKAGYELGSDPKAQWIAECVGAVVGALVSVPVLFVIVKAYGGASFGTEVFPAAQAAAVAAMVGGISNLPAFIAGLVIAMVLYFLRFPVMTLGLGVYLPSYMSFTAAIGGLLRFIVDKKFPDFEEKSGTGSIVAAGFLGGEGVVGVVIALILAAQAIL